MNGIKTVERIEPFSGNIRRSSALMNMRYLAILTAEDTLRIHQQVRLERQERF